MKGLTLSTIEQNRLQILNGVLERYWSVREAAPLLGVSERQGWRLLAAYRKEGARGLVHKNRGRVPPNATPETIQQQVVALARERYGGINHTQLSELLAEREGLILSRPTVRRLLGSEKNPLGSHQPPALSVSVLWGHARPPPLPEV